MLKKLSKVIRYLVAFALIIVVIIIAGSVVPDYNVTPSETYSLEKQNSIDDGSFENFNQTAGDCCNSNPNASRVYASKSLDAFEGNFSLNLTSLSQCACAAKSVLNFTNSSMYFLSFYYKGQNPHFCNWVNGDRKCMPNSKLSAQKNWSLYYQILSFTNNSLSSSLSFYADSSGELVTNLYDDLQVHKLIPIENPPSYAFNPEEEYIFKTKADNRVKGELISDVDAKTGEAYFLAMGKPNVTIKFPWTELVLVILIMLVIIRLLFKKQVEELGKEAGKEAKEMLKQAENVIKPIEDEIREAAEAVKGKMANELKDIKAAVRAKDEEAPDMTDPHRRKLWYSEGYRKKYAEKYGL